MNKNNLLKLTLWQTSDGRQFKSKEDADQHQAVLDFEGWYNIHPIKGAKATADVLLWLRSNALDLDKVLRAFLNARVS